MIKGPQTFAIITGISKYQYVRPLAYADKDAELFRDWLRSPGGGSINDGNIFCLLNEEANNSNFWGKGFQWLKAKRLQKGDKLFIYMAGHGDAIDEDQFFFLGYDCNPMGDKNNYLVSGAIQLFNLKKKIKKETEKGVDVFFIMDACRSNELPGGSAGQNFLNAAILEKQAGEIMMLATAAGQPSLEDASVGNGHGLFTWYLIDGLSGLADNQARDNRITFKEISTYVDQHVPQLALQRFKRKQEPYFCCSESNEKIIGSVDTGYLNRWIKNKKEYEPKTGNSFREINFIERSPVDTVLIETYNRFYRQIKNNNLTGRGSAEEYYHQLSQKFPQNPYTLDAKSTLAVEYLNVAQRRVDAYLGCADHSSDSEKVADYIAGVNLEKAIESFMEDDEDFARSLYGRVFLLKSNGEYGPRGKHGNISRAFDYGYAALSFDPNGAFAWNKLAQLHMQNNNRDSALFYARRAAQIAPSWACALTTLASIQQTTNNSERQKKGQERPKAGLGVTIGIGLNSSNPSIASNPQGEIIAVETNSAVSPRIGLTYEIGLSGMITVRPTLKLVFENTSVDFLRRAAAGAPLITETIKAKEFLINVAVPLMVKLGRNKIAPYIVAGPSINFSLLQNDSSIVKLPLKKFSTGGDIGIGVNIAVDKARIIISPEIKYSYGFTDLKRSSNSEYSSSMASLRRSNFSLGFYIRKK